MIVATAGHVDHGKTSLVKQLTGVDTDRLEEEKRRGLSINLGFAYRRLTDDPGAAGQPAADPDGLPLYAAPTLGFIDVPGHKRFINTMIAGVSSIDLGMLIVAADDGPMPQTVEHLDAMRLLGIEDYVLVVTKIDKVDGQRVAAVRESVLELMGETAARVARAFEVSNITGDGVTELQRFLDQRALSHQARTSKGIFRLSVDRAFTLKGLGLVVTGTVTAGEVSVGDSVQILPDGATLRVRNVHAQDQAVQRGRAGQRCALNIVGDIEKSDVERGDWLVGLGSAGVSERFDARCRLLDDAPVSLKHMAPVKLYIGAKRIAARIYLLESQDGDNRMQPGDDRLVQLIVDKPISCCRGERFLLRDDSESFTLGGGMVLDAKARRVRKVQAEHLDLLTALELPDFVAGLRQLVLKQQQIVDFDAFRQSWNIREAEAEEALRAAGLLEQLKLCKTGRTRFAVANDRWLSMGQGIVDVVNDWHATHPADAGMTPGELEKQLGKLIDHRLFAAVLDALAGEGRLSLVGGLVSCEAVKHWQRVQDFLQSRGLEIPSLTELETESGLESAEIANAVRAAVEDGKLYKINDKRIGLACTLRDLADHVNILAQSQSAFSAVDYRKQVGIGRRFAVELLEYFDSIGFTQRNGNERIVLNDKIPEKFFGS